MNAPASTLLDISWRTWALVFFFSAILGSIVTRGKRRSVEGFWLGLLLGPLGVLFAIGLHDHYHAKKPRADLSKKTTDALSAEEFDFRVLMAKRGKVGIAVHERKVIRVAKGSAADLAGVKVGDRLVLIDNHECKSSHRELLLQLTGPVDTAVNIVLRRGGEIIDLTLLRK